MLEVKNVDVSFRSEKQTRIFGTDRTKVLHDISIKVDKGSCLGILGESGSGKSTLGRVICGLLKPDRGDVNIEGIPVYGSKNGQKRLQNSLSVVFQDYTTSANPRFKVRDILREGIMAYERKSGKKADTGSEYDRLLDTVGLDGSFLMRYPHELSGGQLQRVCIARAVACRPEIILFDEAISSLDAHTQVQIMDLLKKLKEELSLTYIFITHDLTSVTYICDNVLFLYKGRVTEYIPVNRIAETKDDYARQLLDSIIMYEDEISA